MQHTAVLPHCAAVVRLQYLFPTRPICIRNPPLPPPRPPATLSRTIARTPEWPTFRFHPFKPPPSVYAPRSLFSLEHAGTFVANLHAVGRASFRVNSMMVMERHGTGGRGGGRAKALVSSRARQRINGAGLSSGFQSRGGGCCSRSSSSPLRYEAAFAAAERQRSRD